MKEWWQEAFGKGWYPLPSITADWIKKTKAEAGALEKILALPRGARILDLACGTGRHSIALARLGYQVTGVDISPHYLREAKQRARKEKVAVRFLAGDMRTLPFHGEFEAVINLFSSFGYFRRASDDTRVIREIKRALVPGGIFVIDNMNLDFIRHHFVAQSWLELSDGTLLLEQRKRLGPTDTVAEARWLFVSPGGRRTRMLSRIRGYTRETLTDLLIRNGLQKVRSHFPLYGEQDKSRYAWRVVLSARKGRN